MNEEQARKLKVGDKLIKKIGRYLVKVEVIYVDPLDLIDPDVVVRYEPATLSHINILRIHKSIISVRSMSPFELIEQ